MKKIAYVRHQNRWLDSNGVLERVQWTRTTGIQRHRRVIIQHLPV